MLIRQKPNAVTIKRRVLILSIVATLAVLGPAAAGAIAASTVSADLKVQSMTAISTTSVTSVITHTVLVVQNDNDDDARNVQLIVTFPPTSHILSAQPALLTSSFVAEPSTRWPAIASATFALGTIPVNGTSIISIWSEMLQAAATPDTSIGAFVYGSLPDPIGANNFRSALVKAAAS
jgi:hypothetical protein